MSPREPDAPAAGGAVSVNGVTVDTAGFPSAEAAAARELLRQRAVATGLAADGAGDAEVEAAIERLLEREVVTPEPTEPECRRYHEANAKLFTSGELIEARHILYQSTEATPLPALRERAESALAEVLDAPERFTDLAKAWSNCPSAALGGNLGQLQRGESVPEFDRALFGDAFVGIRRELARTRYGFHIVAVDHRVAGTPLPFEAVREQVAARLRSQVLERALAQYVSVLAGAADVRGADLAAAPSPLVQ